MAALASQRDVDHRWMGAALTLCERARGRSYPNPNVGCVIVGDGRVVGRGWTQPGGRPHAEAMALAQAGDAACGATAYVTLEPCAHVSTRGPACSDALIAAGIGRVVYALDDPDPRTNGMGAARLTDAGITVTSGVRANDAAAAMAGFLTRQRLGRPHVTLKLAMSLDGCIATASGESKWITGERARAHAHLVRARSDAILVGRGTYEADQPRLDVRLDGLEDRSPKRVILTGGSAPSGWTAIATPEGIAALPADWLMIEGGAQTASAFLAADLVDTLLIYRAPILIGNGRRAVEDIGLAGLEDAHGRWNAATASMLGSDQLSQYERNIRI